MPLLKTAALAALGYVGYRAYKKSQASGGHAAFASGQGDTTNFSQVRDAGPDAMGSAQKPGWSRIDEASDESFPASDPPANY
jgi:hypothetical protein